MNYDGIDQDFNYFADYIRNEAKRSYITRELYLDMGELLEYNFSSYLMYKIGLDNYRDFCIDIGNINVDITEMDIGIHCLIVDYLFTNTDERSVSELLHNYIHGMTLGLCLKDYNFCIDNYEFEYDPIGKGKVNFRELIEDYLDLYISVVERKMKQYVDLNNALEVGNSVTPIVRNDYAWFFKDSKISITERGSYFFVTLYMFFKGKPDAN